MKIFIYEKIHLNTINLLTEFGLLAVSSLAAVSNSPLSLSFIDKSKAFYHSQLKIINLCATGDNGVDIKTSRIEYFAYRRLCKAFFCATVFFLSFHISRSNNWKLIAKRHQKAVT